MEQERREAARRKVEERREAARLKEEQRKAEIARKKNEAIEARERQAAAKRQQQEDAKRKAEEQRQATRLKEEQRKAETERKKAEAIEAAKRAEQARAAAAEATRKAVAEAKIAAEKIAADKAAAARVAAEKAAADRIAAAKTAAEKAAVGKLAAKAAADKAAADKLAAKAAADRAAADKLIAKAAADKAAADKLAAARATAEKAASDKAAAARAVAAKAAAAKAAARSEAEVDRKLLATMNNPKESIAMRKIAAIALGKNPDAIGLGQSSSIAATPRQPTAAEREIAAIAMGKVRQRSITAQPQMSTDDMLRATMNNPKESLAARKIAAIGLGLDPATVGQAAVPAATAKSAIQVPAVSQPARPNPAGQAATPLPTKPATGNYTFVPTVYGTVQVLKDGQRIATVTPQLAAQQYGYQIPAASAKIASDSPKSTVEPSTPTAKVPLQGSKSDAPSKNSTAPGLTTRQLQNLSDQSAHLTPSPPVPAAPANSQSNKGLSRSGGTMPAGQTSQLTGFYAMDNKTGSQTSAITPHQTTNLWVSIQGAAKANEAMLTSRPGQIVVETLKAAGGPITKSYSPALAKIGTAGDLAKAADNIRRKDYMGLAEQAADKVAVEASGALGGLLIPVNPALGQSIGKGSAQFVITTWKMYGAPVVGDALVKAFPDVFIPPIIP